MKRFKEYLMENEIKGTYAAVRPDVKHSTILSDFMEKHKIPNPESTDKLHATLLYSRKFLPTYKPNKDLNHEAILDKFEIWPTKSGKNCLVLKFTSPTLVARHNDLMSKHNATYDYPLFKTHMSLSYDIGEFDISKITIEELPKTMIFTNEYHEDLDTGGK